ncbi:MAG: hypothetical protein KGM47_16965, partial [Acidobacteriota bacterium]|nr:hypothetical protein [Acidobacteriota bacterium]
KRHLRVRDTEVTRNWIPACAGMTTPVTLFRIPAFPQRRESDCSEQNHFYVAHTPFASSRMARP